ncbi:MAG: hypothetical protein HGA75_02815 [Thiobacillus sp.]|nr:hypothetical protein [Thiobacillus sp.]
MSGLDSSRAGRLLGWPGLAAVALAVAGAALYGSVVGPAGEREDALRLKLDALTTRLHAAAKAAQVQTPAQQLDQFYQAFPAERGAVDQIGKIAEIAHRHGLNLEQGEYKTAPDRQGRLVRMQMILPLKGSYQQIRGCLGDLTRELPNVALEQVLFERQKVGDPVLNAKLRLVLFLGKST